MENAHLVLLHCERAIEVNIQKILTDGSLFNLSDTVVNLPQTRGNLILCLLELKRYHTISIGLLISWNISVTRYPIENHMTALLVQCLQHA